MSDRFTLERSPTTVTGDPLLLMTLVLLVGIGLSSLFSASYEWAGDLNGDAFHFVRRQAMLVVIGVAGAIVAARISLERLSEATPLLLLAVLILMVLTFVPGIGAEAFGARRWIFLAGYSYQPSEAVKLVLVFYLASILSKKEDRLDDTLNSLLPPLIVVAVFAGLIYLQNDFSTSMFVIFVALLMLFAARVRLRFFISLAILLTPLTVILLLTREHRVMRILAFLDPTQYPLNSGYQVLASQRALAQGGVFGLGIGQSIQKAGAIPEPHSDFVFAVVGEELGLIGVLAILALFVFFAYRGFRLSLQTADRFRSLLAFGVTATVLFQALLNMAVVVGLVPATGIPLPFFSAGGSSMMTTLVMCGLLFNVARTRDTVREPAEAEVGNG